MLKPINIINNAVRATRSLGPSSKARRTTCSVKPLGAILLALLMTLSSPVAAQDFQKGHAAFLAKDYATALQEWMPLADQGYAQAQFFLGFMYTNGDGVPQDHAEALKWYRLAADQGNANAQYYIGNMYNQGQGVPEDYAEAMKWYRLAANQGQSVAQFNLGLMYEYGISVLQDNVMAHMWYNIASANSFQSAGDKRVKIAKTMTPAAIEKATAMARECMSSGYTKCGY